MKFFKKEGKIKFRKTKDADLVEKWTSDGWAEVNPKTGEPVANSSSKSKAKK
tara:strand:- start:270 stop:425 length:156 start_codon:yes stop_codon:yes gene_type:complete